MFIIPLCCISSIYYPCRPLLLYSDIFYSRLCIDLECTSSLISLVHFFILTIYLSPSLFNLLESCFHGNTNRVVLMTTICNTCIVTLSSNFFFCNQMKICIHLPFKPISNYSTAKATTILRSNKCIYQMKTRNITTIDLHNPT